MKFNIDETSVSCVCVSPNNKGMTFWGVHCVISAMTVGTMQNLPDAEKVLHRYCYHFK